MANIDIIDEYGTNKIFTGAFLGVLFVCLVSQISTLIGYTIDGIITSRFLGGMAMSVAGLFVPLSTVIGFFSGVISKGNSVVCSNKIGAMKQKEASQVFSSAVFLELSISFVFTLIFLCFAPFWAKLVSSGANDEIRLILIKYIRGIAIGIPGMAVVYFFTPVIQLLGDNRRVTIASVVLCISNIIGDLINVLVIHGGMFGMGLTSSISYYISAMILLSYFLKGKSMLDFRFSYIRKDFFMDIFKTGSTNLFHDMASTMRSKTFNSLAMLYGGASDFPAFATVNNFSAVLSALPKAFGATSLLMQGILMGEEDKKTVKNVLNLSLIRALIYNIIFAGLIYVIAPYLALLYTPSTSDYYYASVSGIRWYGACLIPYAINSVYINYLQCNQKLMLVNILEFADGFLASYIFALIMTKYIALNGVMAAFFVGKLFVSLAIVIWVSIKNKHFSLSVSDYLLLPDDFGISEENQFNHIITSPEDAVSISKGAIDFFEKHNFDKRQAMLAGLCVEEFAVVLIEHGFNDKKRHYIDIRLAIKQDNIFIRFRDNCKPVNPVDFYKLDNPDDPAANIGIKMIINMASKVEYTKSLQLNNLLIVVL